MKDRSLSHQQRYLWTGVSRQQDWSRMKTHMLSLSLIQLLRKVGKSSVSKGYNMRGMEEIDYAK
jgi:hypothetical protein